MTNREYNLWSLTELRQDDPREYLDIIIANAKYDKVQAIKYKGDTVFVISENQYKKFKNS
jgi:sulfur relay (sulfurtransferase) DsrF/TusC family protein